MSAPSYGYRDRNTAPCKDCTSRHGSCHDSCLAYQSWLAFRRKEDHYEAIQRSVDHAAAQLRFKRRMSLVKGRKIT